MNSAPIPETWRQAYLKRPIAQLPADVNRAYDELRAQRRDIDRLRHQLGWAKAKNYALMALLGGAAAKGIEVAVIALLKLLAH